MRASVSAQLWSPIPRSPSVARVRRIGHSKRGRRAKTNRYLFNRGRRFSCLGPFVLNHGFLGECIVEGAFNSDSFLAALVQCVARRLHSALNQL